eukprot:5876611-Ditylum_brightwellii.AAC.1
MIVFINALDKDLKTTDQLTDRGLCCTMITINTGTTEDKVFVHDNSSKYDSIKSTHQCTIENSSYVAKKGNKEVARDTKKRRSRRCSTKEQ